MLRAFVICFAVATHARHRLGQPCRDADQIVVRKWLLGIRQARLAGVGKGDRPGVVRRIQHLRHAHHTTEPLEDSHLMMESALRVWTQRHFADDRASRQEKPGHPGASAIVHYLGSNGYTPIRHRAVTHRPPHTRPTAAASYLTPIRVNPRQYIFARGRPSPGHSY
jgi:hypothetical protein